MIMVPAISHTGTAVNWSEPAEIDRPRASDAYVNAGWARFRKRFRKDPLWLGDLRRETRLEYQSGDVHDVKTR